MRGEALARALARRLATGACAGLLLACAPADRAEPDATGGVDTEPNALAAYDVRVRGLEAQWRTPRSRDCA